VPTGAAAGGNEVKQRQDKKILSWEWLPAIFILWAG
jgi:hypothetical protein